MAESNVAKSPAKKSPVAKVAVAAHKKAAKKVKAKEPSKAAAARKSKSESKAIEKKIVGKVVVGKRQMLVLNPVNIVVNKGFNPRIDTGSVAELMKSIKKNGVQQPIKVRKVGKHFELVDGERRLVSVLKLGMKEIPALEDVGKRTEEELLNLALIMNDGVPLAPVEEADAFRRLVKGGWSAAAIATATGKSKRLVKDRLTLISAHPDVAAAVRSGKLSVGLGLAIAKKAKGDKKKQSKLAKKAASSKTGTKKVATTLGKASLKTKLDKKNVDLSNRLIKLVDVVNKRRKRGEKKVPKTLVGQRPFFSKHPNREVRAAFVAGGISVVSDVLSSANAKKATRGRRVTARGTSSRRRGK